MSTDNQSAQSAVKALRAAMTECGVPFEYKGAIMDAFERHLARSALAQAPAPSGEAPDMPAICAALGFDPTNHHNAAKCPYCSPATPPTPEQAGNLSPEMRAEILDELHNTHGFKGDVDEMAAAIFDAIDFHTSKATPEQAGPSGEALETLQAIAAVASSTMTALNDGKTDFYIAQSRGLNLSHILRLANAALASPGAMEGAQAAQPEPVAWRYRLKGNGRWQVDERPPGEGQFDDEHEFVPLYAHPPTGEPT